MVSSLLTVNLNSIYKKNILPFEIIAKPDHFENHDHDPPCHTIWENFGTMYKEGVMLPW